MKITNHSTNYYLKVKLQKLKINYFQMGYREVREEAGCDAKIIFC